MRTKKLLLLAAMLLSGVCATFAQSENEHPLDFILGIYEAEGEDYYNNWAVENWTATIKKDDSDPSKVWIYDFTPAGFPDAIYGIVNEERTEIRIPVNQTIGSNSSYDVVLEAYTNNGDADITDFIVGTISEDGTITITPTTWIAAAAYNKGTTTLAGYYAIDRAVVFKKTDMTGSGIFLNAANFPDANFRTALAKILGISEGDEITEAKIAATTTLDVSSKQIADLTGIEHFTALTDLYCYSNQLASLDVSGCTALTTLYCSYNQLTSLNVSKNTALTTLYCSYNQLTSLDVLSCTALTDLYCYSNQLTSLDVSKNTALRELVCSYNQLTLLDVSKNTLLTTLWCDNNQLTSLDVSKNTELDFLQCFDNQLTSLDVSKNTALTELYCINNQLTSLDVSKNTALTYLSCYNNQLTSLDVSQNTALKSLNCSDNQLTSLDVLKNTALTRLSCHNNQLTSLDVSQNIALEWLECDGNQLTSFDMSKNTALEYLFCFSNQIKGEAMDALVNSLPTVTKGDFVVIDTKDENEGNVCTKAQVAVAKGKGWTVYDYFGGGTYNQETWQYVYPEYEGSDPVEEEIDPVDEDDNVDFGSDMDEGDDLDGNVIGDIFYNISDGNGEYNAEDGFMVLNKTTDDETVDGLSGKDIFGEDFKGQFTGILFKVPSGKGTVKVTAETTGNMLLKVKIGDNDPVEMELNGKLKISFPYNVSETTFVAIYAGAANEAKGFGTTNAMTDAALKIYGIEFERGETTEIGASLNDNGEMTNDSWYTLDGVKLSGEPMKKGIYIRNGKKVVK